MKCIFKSIIIISLFFNFCVNASQIKFMDYKFDPLISVPDADSDPLVDNQGQGLQLVQFDGLIKQTWLDQLKNQNMVILQYYPDNTYLVWGSTQQLDLLESQDFVRWSGSFARAYRKSNNLKGRSGYLTNVDVHFYNSGSPDQVIEKLKNAGAEILNYFPAQPDKKLYDAIIRISHTNLPQLTDIAEVVWVGFIGAKAITDDESSSQTVAGNFDVTNQPLPDYGDWLTSIGLDGTGVIWSITDTGVDYTHGDLNTRIIGGHNYPGCIFTDPGDDPASGGHGTHVAGITGGDGSGAFRDADGYLYGLGVAPAYSIFAQNPICGSNTSWPPAGGWQELSKQAALGGAVGSNNSWTSGEGTNHGYQATERTIDFATRDANFDTTGIAEEFMWVFSAGNSGPGANTLTAPKEAKNVIVTAGTQTWRVSGDVDAMYNSSSRGPSVDGRFVPTIAAPGQQVGSTRNDDGGSCGTAIPGTNDLYSFCTGTSMAAPHTSGSLVLITQWWRQNNAGATPSVAMAKGLLINSAQDITDAGPIPNFNEGWGRINLKNLFEAETPFAFYDQETVLDNSGEMWQISVGVVDTNKPLKVTLVWSDAPGAIGANPSLVNNLDLEVTNAGNTYLGNSFNNGSSTTGGNADVLNNMENVFINAPGGSAIITVKATSISGDGVPIIGDGTDQDFALICSNCAVQPDFTLDTQQSAISVCAPSDAVYDVNIGSILSFADPVTMSTSGLPANATDAFSANPVIPGNSLTLTIANTANIAAANYVFDLQATSTTGMKTRSLGLNVFNAIPAATVLQTPGNNANLVAVMPTFTWNDATQADIYVLEVDDNQDFSSIEYTATVSATSYNMDQPLNTSTVYYWRIRSENSCGTEISTVFSFTTEPAPGDCPQVATPQVLFTDDVESGTNGWTTEGTQNTWQINTNNAVSGVSSWHAEDVTSVSDQRLISPQLVLPVGQNPLTLSFQNHQTLEDSATGCWDGSILEVSTDGGVNWTYMAGDKMLTDPYDAIFRGTVNPLTGQNFVGWCGDPQDWTRSIVDLDELAGQTVQFRFRLATDGSVGRPEGWKIDDISVKSCQYPDLIYTNGFE